MDPYAEKPLECLLLDGKTDLTKVRTIGENGKVLKRTILEEHIILVGQPGDVFLGHVAPEKKDAKSVAQSIWTFLVEQDDTEDLKVIGGDSTVHNTGHKGGIFFFIQEWIGHRLLISVCKLHTNELPLRHVIKFLGIPTLSNNKFGGELGELICGSIELLPFDPNFERIKDDRVVFPRLPEEIINDLSTDQRYAYRILALIMGEDVDLAFLDHKIGDVNHCRWLTTGDRFCSLYVRKHGLVGKNKEVLTLVVKHSAFHYFPMWFRIKCAPTLLEGPRHVFAGMRTMIYFYMCLLVYFCFLSAT